MAQARSAAKPTETGRLKGVRILVVEARYYEEIADALLAGAARALDAAQVTWDHVTVPGALEIPSAIVIACDAAKRRRKTYDGVVALGCVIRGETTHYEIVSNESARALMELSVERALPIGNGILTVENEAQALARARPAEMDKGGGAAQAALALVALRRNLDKPRKGRRT